MHRARHTGLIVCAIALLAAGCSSSGDASNAYVPPPTAADGGGQQGTGGKHHQKPGKPHHNKPGAGSATSSSAPHPTDSSAPAPGGHSSSHPAPGPSSTASGGGGHNGGGHNGGGSGGGHSSSPPPANNLPRVTVTPSSGLASEQTVTVEGFNFTPNTLLAVAECHDRGLDTGLPDCNISNVITYAPGAKVHSDANGHVGPVQITVRKTFKQVDCGSMKCLVAISEPRLSPDPADEGDQYIHFA